MSEKKTHTGSIEEITPTCVRAIVRGEQWVFTNTLLQGDDFRKGDVVRIVKEDGFIVSLAKVEKS